MSLVPGTRLGAYEVVALVGAGGMGEVYRARDTRLQRDVALKVLSEGVVADADRLARFEQEARATAALNHPNIVALFDIGSHDGRPFLVSELLEGRSLREALSEGPLPLRKAIDYCIQVATGLAAAHEKGIVHRDLKPDNVFITNEDRAKILDFGIAKLVDDDRAQARTAATMAAPRTDAGQMLGTSGYMAPEQIRGGTVDARTDIFALGAMLFEMVSGARPFAGATQADTMSAVLSRDPSELVLPDGHTPASVDRIVRRCLEKSPAHRFQSARDLAFALEAITVTTTRTGVSPVTTTARRRIAGRELAAWTLALAAIAVAAVALWRQEAAPSVTVPVARFAFEVPSGELGSGGLTAVISPDGRYLVMQTSTRQLYLRRLDNDAIVVVPGSEGARGAPFWSPDSRAFAFRTATGVMRFDVAVSQSTRIAAIPIVGIPTGAAWGAHNTMLFSAVNAPISRVNLESGALTPLRPLDEGQGETSHTAAVFLPDGERFFCLSLRRDGRHTLLASTRNDTVVPLPDFDGRIIWAGHDWVVFRRGTRLLAQRIRYSPLGLEGEATQIAGDLEDANISAAVASVSDNGVVAYAAASNSDQQFVWFERSGRRLNTVGPPGTYPTFDLSPDNSKLVVTRREGVQNLWVYDTMREAASRVTFDPGGNHLDPRFAPDSRSVLFGNTRDPQRRPYRTTLSGDTPAPVAFPFKGRMIAVDDWSPDGKWLLFHDAGMAAVTAVRLDQPNQEPMVVARAFTGVLDQAAMSPDGRWVSYNSDESGRNEIYVVPFPPTGDKVQVSVNGGVQPTWRRDGGELYYLAPDGTLMSARIRPGGTFTTDTPVALFKTPIRAVNQSLEQYQPASDGTRFLVQEDLGALSRKVTVITNWMGMVGAETRNPQ